jgi:hypothetical protein
VVSAGRAAGGMCGVHHPVEPQLRDLLHVVDVEPERSSGVARNGRSVALLR